MTLFTENGSPVIVLEAGATERSTFPDCCARPGSIVTHFAN